MTRMIGMKKIMLIIFLIIFSTAVHASGIDSYTKLMLHADGDDAFSIGDGYGTFDGSGDYVEMPGDAALRQATPTFAVWVKTDDPSALQQIHRCVDHADDPSGWGFSSDISNNLFSCWLNTGSANGLSTPIGSGRHHLACTYNGSVFKLYLDGVEKNSTSLTGAVNYGTGDFLLGVSNSATKVNAFDGSMDDASLWSRPLSSSEISQLYDRGVQGLANNITSGLVAYYPMDSDFTDAAGSNDGTAAGNAAVAAYTGKTYTANGDPILSSEGEFDGSMYFDGNGDYLSIPDSSDWYFGSDDFTIDFWMKPESTPTGSRGIITQSYHSSSSDRPFEIGQLSGGKVFMQMANNAWYISTPSAMPIGEWSHIAVVRHGNDWDLYLNGDLAATKNDASSLVDGSTNVVVGAMYHDGSYYFDGYIDELRVSKGIARWTSNFTPDTSPYTPDANTALLLHFEGDESGTGHDITLGGDVDADSATSKFEGSYHFEGDSGYLSVPDSDAFSFGSGDFTIDFWARFDTTSNVLDMLSHWGSDNNDRVWLLRYEDGSGSPYFNFYWSDDGVTFDSSPSDTLSISSDTWYHIALVRDGNTLRFFLDGTAVGVGDLTGVTLRDGADEIYVSSVRGLVNFFDGYIDELRISKGIARWTSSFTPDTSPYDTSLSCPDDCSGHGTCNGLTGVCSCETGWTGDNCATYDGACPESLVSYWTFDDADVSGSTLYDYYGDNDGTIVGATTGQAGKVGEAFSFDGNDYISFGDVLDAPGVAGSFSVAAWVKTSNSAQQVIFAKSTGGCGSANTIGYCLYLRTDNPFTRMCVSQDTNVAHVGSASANVIDGTWHHIVGLWDYSAKRSKVYVDGVYKGYGINTYIDNLGNSGSFLLGKSNTNQMYFEGEMDEVAFFNKALNDTEISDLYALAVGGSSYCGSASSNTPTYTEFNDTETTDFSSAENITNVTNVTLAVENKGKIHYPESHGINAESADLDSAITIDVKVIVVNTSALDSTFNSTATLTFENVNCASPYVFYSATASDRASIMAQNQHCRAPRCTNIQCTASTLTVDVTGFSGYAAEGNANLSIDADDPKEVDTEVHFTAEYRNVTSGSLITGANCTIYFTDDTQAMSEGASQYTYNRTFSSSGNKEYNVTCSADGYNTLNADDTATITSSGAEVPEFSIMTLGVGLMAILLGLIVMRRR